MVMVPAMVCLMLAGAIRGFAEVLVLAEVSVGAVVAAEADLVSGGRFKLAPDCRKELILCQEAMEQGRAAGDLGQAEVWVEVKAKGEVEWVDHLPLARVEIVSAQVVDIRWLMLLASLVMQ